MKSPLLIALFVAPLALAQSPGVNNVTSPQQSTLKDFLTPLGATLDVSTLDTKQKALTLNFNPIPGQLALDTTFVTPRVNDVVSNYIGDVQAAKIEKNLSASDDVVVALSFNRRTRRWGVSDAAHHALIEQLTAAAVNLETDLKPRLNNQPQVYATAIYHRRTPDVGPNASGVRLTWEIGSQNLNDFYANEGRDCGASCADAFHRFVTRTPGAANAARFNLAIEYRMREKPATSTAAPAVTLKSPHHISGIAGYGRPFTTLAGGKEGRLDFKVEYDGRKTTATPGAKVGALAFVNRAPALAAPALTAPYDRITAAATFTQQISDRISTPVSLVWTDRVESFVPSPIVSPYFPQSTRGDTKKLAVHVGITYKLSPPRPSSCSCCCR